MTDKNEDTENRDESGGQATSDLLAELPLFETVEEAMEAASEHLPNGYDINVIISKHGYGVTLGTPECDEIDLDGGDGMRSDIRLGIMQANGIDC